MKKYMALLLLLTFVAGSVQAQPSQAESESKPGLTPDHPLYSIEKLVERIEVKAAGIIGGPELKAKAIANNADERLAEANALAERNKTEKTAELVEKYSKGMNNSQKIASRSNNQNLSQKIGNLSERNIEKLEKVREKVPEQAKGAIDKAINNSEKRRDARDKGRSNKSKKPKIPENKTEMPKERANNSLDEARELENNVSEKRDKTENNITESKRKLENGKNSISDPITNTSNTNLETSDRQEISEDKNPIDRRTPELP